MFDDDLSYLESCAKEIRGYGLNVLYSGTHAIVGIHRTSSEHIVGVIRKKQNIPFYQAFLIEAVPSSADYLALVNSNTIVTWVLGNRDLIKQFVAVDISGHDNFQTQFVRELKERFK